MKPLEFFAALWFALVSTFVMVTSGIWIGYAAIMLVCTFITAAIVVNAYRRNDEYTQTALTLYERFKDGGDNDCEHEWSGVRGHLSTTQWIECHYCGKTEDIDEDECPNIADCFLGYCEHEEDGDQ